ncbi:DUF domain-containing protein [Robertmurraya kyonggiensis]|uniref:DUF domain-containing protein n=1 Tax=Robertmurraya kyonggiensis TaxID=1037680 RepID=A0A4U1CVI9_9BACI|nr:DUF domain-containing protein [Robertmurraya kyonggiensis]
MFRSNVMSAICFAGEGIASPTGRDIDGKYLDQNERDLQVQYAKFQAEWPMFGVTLMCDSWTGPTKMSVINFLIYCNGVMWFHKSVDATGRSQDSAYLRKVTPYLVHFDPNIIWMLLKNMCITRKF